MANIDDVINKCVDDIWKDYGKKGSDSLSKDQTRKFVMEINKSRIILYRKAILVAKSI